MKDKGNSQRNGGDSSPTSLPASSRTDWARLEALRDQDIDLSDAPEVGPEFFRRARPHRANPDNPTED